MLAKRPRSSRRGDAAEVQPEPEAPKPVLLWRPLARGDQGRGRNGQRGEGDGDGRERPQGKGRFKGKGGGKPGGRGPRDGQNERPPRHGDGGKGGRPPRKEKPIDPDSPFAKLAALKEQMKK